MLRTILWTIVLLAGAGCDAKRQAGSGESGGGGFAQKNEPASLDAVVEKLLRALDTGDAANFEATMKGLIPDEAAVKKALRDDAPPEAIAKVLASAKRMHLPFEAGMIHAEVYDGTTGKEIAEQSTPASGHFSGYDRRAAEEILRPDLTFYNVRIAKSAGGEGNTLHLFFWDGSRWRMLGHLRDE
jgi:hypothetical protein